MELHSSAADSGSPSINLGLGEPIRVTQQNKKRPSYMSLMAPQPWRCVRTDGKRWRCSRNVIPGDICCEQHMNRSRWCSRKHKKASQNVLQSNTTKRTTKTVGSSNTADNIKKITENTAKMKTTSSANGIIIRSNKSVDANNDLNARPTTFMTYNSNNESSDNVNLSSDNICTATATTSNTAVTDTDGSKKNNNDGFKDMVNKHNMNRSTNNGSNCKIDGSARSSEDWWCAGGAVRISVQDKMQKKKLDSALLSLLEKAVGTEGMYPSKLGLKRRLVTLPDKEDCTPKKAHVGDRPIAATEPLHNVSMAGTFEVTASDAGLLAFALEALKKLRVSTMEIVRRLFAQEADLMVEQKRSQEVANRAERLENEINTLREAHKNLADKAVLDKGKLGEALTQARKAQDELVGEVSRREEAEKAREDLRTTHAEEVGWLKAELAEKKVAEGSAEQVADLKQRLDQEFAMGFFSGYQDLQERALSDHPDWDLSIYDPKMSSVWGRDA